jgi:MFS family permease
MAQAESTPFQIRSLTLTVYAPTLLMGIGQSAVLAFVPLLARDLGASIGLAGLVFAMRGLGVMVFDVPAGLLLSRIGPRRSMLLSITLIGLFASLAAISRDALQLAAAVFALGAATALWMLTRMAFVADAAPVDQRGRALSLVGGSQRMGNFVGPVAAGFVAQFTQVSGALWLQSIGAAGALVLVFVFVRDRDRMTVTAGHVPTGLVSMLKEHRQVFLTAGVAMLALQLLRQGRQVLLPLWSDQLGLELSEIGLVIGLASAIDMSLFYPVGIVMDRFGRKWSAVPSMILLAASLALIPLTDSFQTLMVVGLLSGLANGLGAGVGMTLGADLAPSGNQGEFIGVWRFISDIGTSAGPFMVAGVAGVATLGMACVATGGVGLVGAAVMAFLAPETLRHRQDAVAKRSSEADSG